MGKASQKEAKGRGQGKAGAKDGQAKGRAVKGKAAGAGRKRPSDEHKYALRQLGADLNAIVLSFTVKSTVTIVTVTMVLDMFELDTVGCITVYLDRPCSHSTLCLVIMVVMMKVSLQPWHQHQDILQVWVLTTT